nr:hypothetical protein [uncultured Pseudodesulfovibrio sp.]
MQKEIAFPPPKLSGGSTLSTIVDMFKSALSNRSGGSRPSDVQVGETWLDTSAPPLWTLKLWTGGVDIQVMTFNTDTGTVTTAATAANALALAGRSLAQGADASSVVQRTAAGDIHGRYLNMNHASANRINDTVFYSSTDDFIRKNDKAGMQASLGLRPGVDIESYVSKRTGFNLNKATQAQAEAGELDTVLMTPLRTKQLMDMAGGGMWEHVTTLTLSATTYAEFTGLEPGKYKLMLDMVRPSAGYLSLSCFNMSWRTNARYAWNINCYYRGSITNSYSTSDTNVHVFGNLTSYVSGEIDIMLSSTNFSIRGFLSHGETSCTVSGMYFDSGATGFRIQPSVAPSGTLVGKALLYKLIEV